jgi:hypothetical protein
MEILKNKSKISAITFVLVLTIATLLVVLTTVNAQNVSEAKTHIYVSPQPVTGVGQQMFIVYWIDRMPVPETDEELAAGKRGAYYGITLTITKPDNSEETLEMPRTDPVGGGYLLYTPDQVGTYSVQAHFPGNWRNSSVPAPPFYFPPADTWYMPSESVSQTFTVQEDPIEGWPDPPFQEDYLTRPISGASHWSAVAGNWLGRYAQMYPPGSGGDATSNYGYGLAPGSAHILWTRQHYPSGSLMDERFGNEQYTLNHYQDVDFDGDDLILDGVIHYTPQYTAHWGAGSPVDSFGWAGLDLYTGELLFVDSEAMKPAFGQIYLYNSPNQHGGFSYVWRTSNVEMPENVTRLRNSGSWFMPEIEETVTNLHSEPGKQTWEMIDAYTRNRVCYVANVSASGTQVYGKDGSVLFYNTVNLGTSSSPNYYLTIWNSSAAPTMLCGNTSTEVWQWRPQYGGHSNYNYRFRENKDAFHDGNTAWSLNVSIPNIQGPRNPVSNQTASIRVVREGEYVIFATTGSNDERGVVPCWLMAVSLERGHEGEKLWETSITPPQDSVDDNAGVSLASVYPEDEVVVFNYPNKLKWYVYDMRTGQKLWESEPENPFGYYSMSDNYYDGMLLTTGRAGGVLNAYNIRTGEIEWTYIAEGAGTESPYGNALISGMVISDGKIYVGASEHSASTPLWRGPNLRCIDAETGEELWKILFWGSAFSVADGILVGFNWYDGQVYAFGRGPSETTVEAPMTAIPLGESVLIRGTVTDQTPTGRRNINGEYEFTLEGTPAISDEDMGQWMQYLFMDQAYPKDAKGVPVKLTAIDPNGNFQDIGEATSDISGSFGKSWTPPVPGEYQVTATFEGSEAYGGSTATTYFVVGEAPAAAQPIEPAAPAEEPAAPEEPTEPEPAAPEEPTEPEEPEAPTEPEPTEPAEAPLFSTTDLAIIAAVAVAAVIGIAAYWQLRKRK